MGLPPPYPAIYQAIVEGAAIPFLGAGAPLYTRNPKQTPWYERQQNKDVISYLPTAGELADYLAKWTQLPDTERGELTKMAQYYEAVLGPDPLRKRLREVFSCGQEPTPLHDFLAAAPAPLLIVTTNYDDLMERAYEKQGKAYDVVVHVTDSDRVLWWKHGEPEPQEVPADELLIELISMRDGHQSLR